MVHLKVVTKLDNKNTKLFLLVLFKTIEYTINHSIILC